MSSYDIEITRPARHWRDRCTSEVIGTGANSTVEALEQALKVKRDLFASVRIAGRYSGPGYGSSYDPRDGLEGFSSVAEARERFRERQETSGAVDLDSRELAVDANWRVTDVQASSARWPSTSPEDTLELYEVQRADDGLFVAAEPFARLSAGPRGGVVRENY